jgi:hypothetical protein
VPLIGFDFSGRIAMTASDIGTGAEFGADLFELYRAGQVNLPRVANLFAKAASGMHHLDPQLDAVAAGLCAGATAELRTLLRALQHASATTADRTNLAAEALVQIANDYVATDRAAAEEFNWWLRQVEERRRFADPPAAYTAPPRPGDPQSSRPPPGLDRGPDAPVPASPGDEDEPRAEEPVPVLPPPLDVDQPGTAGEG